MELLGERGINTTDLAAWRSSSELKAYNWADPVEEAAQEVREVQEVQEVPEGSQAHLTDSVGGLGVAEDIQYSPEERMAGNHRIDSGSE